MGYAIFATRKLMLIDSISKLNLELMEVTNEIDNVFDLGTAISDGDVSAMDLANCQDSDLAASLGFELDAAGMSRYTDAEYYYGRAQAKKEAKEKYGSSVIGNILSFIAGKPVGAKAKARKEYVDNYDEEYKNTQKEKKVQELQRKIEKMERDLEKKKARIETKLTAKQQELESVKSAEENGIKQATPNFTGVGGGR
jgi:hypothetical protein